MKKIFIFTTILSLVLSSLSTPLYSFAQTATDSSDIIPASSSAIQDFSQFQDPVLENSSKKSDVPLSVITNQESLPSAQFKLPIIVARLVKKNFQAKEQIEIIVKNASLENDIKLEIKNAGGDEVNAQIEEKFVNGEVIFNINPKVGIKPGKYIVKIIDVSTNTILSEQDFTWGVLAINTNKSIYAAGETANIAIGILDESGLMVCDARVILEITSPLGKETILSTQNGSIVVNRECLLHDITEKPDYEASYITNGIGRYLLTLKAETTKGSYTISDRFEVREYVPFDVERITATRIYPPETYPVKIKIKANEAFRGKIVESVPQEFQITPGKQDTVSYQEESIIPESYDPKKETGIPNLPLPFSENYPITLGFGQQINGHGMEDRYKKYGIDGHDGIDFALPEGTPVTAVDNGIVILAQENWVYGHTVVIEHSWGRSYYGHLSKINIAEGSVVSKGAELGLSGSTGLSTGPHLHLGLKPKLNDVNNLYYGKIDPAPFFGLSNEDPTLSTADYPISAKALVWNVDVEKGAEFTIGYQYKAPNKSPYFYTLGPLQFITADIEVATNTAKFDVDINPFVLATATNSAESANQAPNETNQEPIVERVVFQEIRSWQIAVDDFLNVLPNGQIGDTTTDNLSEVTADDASCDPDGGTLLTTDGCYGVDKNQIMSLSSFDTSGIPGGSTITAAVLHLQFGAEDGYNGSNPVRYNNGGGLITTGITPTDITGWSTDQTFDLFANGVDTLSEITNVDIEFTSNDGGGPDAIHFDYVWITVTYTPPSGPTLSQLMRHGKWLAGGTENAFTF